MSRRSPRRAPERASQVSQAERASQASQASQDSKASSEGTQRLSQADTSSQTSGEAIQPASGKNKATRGRSRSEKPAGRKSDAAKVAPIAEEKEGASGTRRSRSQKAGTSKKEKASDASSSGVTLLSVLDKFVSVMRNDDTCPNPSFRDFILEHSGGDTQKTNKSQEIVFQFPPNKLDFLLAADVDAVMKKSVKGLKSNSLISIPSDQNPTITLEGLIQAAGSAPASLSVLNHESMNVTVNGKRAGVFTHHFLKEFRELGLVGQSSQSAHDADDTNLVIPDLINMSVIPLSHTDTEHGVSKEELAQRMEKWLHEINTASPKNAAVEKQKLHIIENANKYKRFIRVIQFPSGKKILQFTRLIYVALDHYFANLMKISKPINTSKKTNNLADFLKRNMSKYSYAYAILESVEEEMAQDFFKHHFPHTGLYEIYTQKVVERFGKAFELQLAFHRLQCEFVKYAQLVQRNSSTPHGTHRCLSPASDQLYSVLHRYIEFSEAELNKSCAGTDKCGMSVPHAFSSAVPMSTDPVVLAPVPQKLLKGKGRRLFGDDEGPSAPSAPSSLASSMTSSSSSPLSAPPSAGLLSPSFSSSLGITIFDEGEAGDDPAGAISEPLDLPEEELTMVIARPAASPTKRRAVSSEPSLFSENSAGFSGSDDACLLQSLGDLHHQLEEYRATNANLPADMAAKIQTFLREMAAMGIGVNNLPAA